MTQRGGQGIAVRCDHAREIEVQVLFRRVREEEGRFDILLIMQGQIVAALAGDARLTRRSGRAFHVGELGIQRHGR